MPSLAFLVLVACSPALRPPDPGLSGSEPVRAWPDPPAAPRYAFVNEFSGPKDLGIRKSWWGRLVGLIAGSSSQEMVRPMAVATADAGRVIYVADPGAQGVHRFDLRGGTYRLLRLDRGAALPSPVGMAISSTGQVYVTDSQLGRLLTLEPGADRLSFLDSGHDLLQPTGVAIDDASGHIFVVDTADHSVKEFSAEGLVVGRFGGRGSAPGNLNYPTYLWHDSQGQLLVSDSLNFRVQLFDTAGGLRGGFGKIGDGSGSLSRPKGVAADSFGHVYVIDSMFHALQVFDSEGSLLLSIGEQGQGPGEFWLPGGLFVDADNRVYVADSHNRRVQVFRYIGATP